LNSEPANSDSFGSTVLLSGPRAAHILELVNSIPDPEIPVISVVELGIIRGIEDLNGNVKVVITPTYSGCPAYRAISEAIVSKLQAHGFGRVELTQQIAPPWTTDWISTEAKEKLRRYGIAPPGPVSDNSELVLFPRPKTPIACPFCGSNKTELKSQFGSTACKAYHFCHSCSQPFEEFKPH
jgi:ring-1,2-phenylacetyl-CoA epoxidase subunit PaaD